MNVVASTIRATALKSAGVSAPLARPHLGEDQADLAARDHGRADHRLAPAEPERRVPRGELARHAARDERAADGERARVAERAHVDRCAHHGEEHGHDEVADRGGGLLDGGALRRLVQHEAGGERADDERRPGRLGEVGEAEGEREAEHDERARRAHPLGRPEERRHREPADDQRGDDEAHRHGRGAQNAPGGDAGARRRRAHHRQDHQADHVVEHRRRRAPPALRASRAARGR
jgi:hypothetical protein